MSEEEKKKVPLRNWGQSQAAFLSDLKGKQVTVVFPDGKAIQGKLTGVDVYDLFVKQTSGAEVLISKGAIKYLHGAETNKT